MQRQVLSLLQAFNSATADPPGAQSPRDPGTQGSLADSLEDSLEAPTRLSALQSSGRRGGLSRGRWGGGGEVAQRARRCDWVRGGAGAGVRVLAHAQLLRSHCPRAQ